MSPSARVAMAAWLIVLAGIPAGPAQGGLRYGTLVDDRAGVTLSYPVDVFTQTGAAPDDPGSVRYVSDDGLASFVLYSTDLQAGGQDGGPGGRMLDRLAAEAERTLSDQGAVLTYRRKKANWFVLSGFMADRIFYRKSVIARDGAVLATLHIVFPREQKPFYIDIVSHMSWSFKARPVAGAAVR